MTSQALDQKALAAALARSTEPFATIDAIIEAYLASLPAPEPVAWRCAKCGCHSYARIDRLSDSGKRAFEPGDEVRCVNCKDVSFYPEPGASPPSPQGLREALWNCANLLDVMAEDAQKNDRTADWSMMSVMAERARAALQSQPAPSGETK